VGSLKMNTALEYSTRVVQEGDRRCKKSTLNDLAYLTPLRIPLMNPVNENEVRPKRGGKSHIDFFSFLFSYHLVIIIFPFLLCYTK
jgi:hypothetical protein